MNNFSLFERAFMNRCRTFIRVNTVTEQVYILKYCGAIVPSFDLPVRCSEFLQTFLSENTIHPDDVMQFDLLKDIKALMLYYEHAKTFPSLLYRRLEGELITWSRLEIIVPEEYDEEHPVLFLYNYDLDALESSIYDSFSVFATKILKISKVSFTDDSIMIIKEPLSERLLHKRFHTKHFSEEIMHIGTHLIYPDDTTDFMNNLSADSLRLFFSYGNKEYTYYCRRKIAGLYRWIRILIIPIRHQAKKDLFYFYMEDVHEDMSKLVDFENLASFSKHFGGLYKQNIESYYTNMLAVLHGLTQPYVDFYMIQLEKDLYIRYKQVSGTVNKHIPYVSSYSQSSKDYIRTHCSAKEAEVLSLYCTSEKLREVMRNRLTLEYEFSSVNGERLRTICQKIESVNGIPTKLLCRTIVVPSSNLLQIRTFGNFEVLKEDGTQVRFGRKQSKELLAYLVDRQGYPVTSKDIVFDVLEKPGDDMNAIKYCSTLIRRTMNDLEAAGYPEVIIKEQKTVRINTTLIDCDYYRLLNGDLSYILQYHNEYMKEYSWAESTNAEILSMMEK